MNQYNRKRMRDFLLRKRLAAPMGRQESSINPSRINRIQSGMVTPNWAHEGQGRQARMGRLFVRHDGSLVPMDLFQIRQRTVKHSKPDSGMRRNHLDRTWKGPEPINPWRHSI